MPAVSVIMAAYNAAATIERAMRSVAANTGVDWELIVVDDCSTDDTLAVARRVAAELGEHVRVLVAPRNGGPALARNLALDIATGEWLAFLDADDEFTPTRLAEMLAATDDGTDAVVSRHAVVSVGGGEGFEGHAAGALAGAAAAREVLLSVTSPYLWDKIFRRTVVADVRFIDVRRAEDKVYVVEAFRQARTVRYLDAALYRYHVSPTSLTWARVAGVEETRRLNAAVAAAAGANDAPVRVAAMIAWLEAAHQAMVKFRPAEARARARACAAQYSWRDVAAALRAAPVFGVAAAALKLLPCGYVTAYGAYTERKLHTAG